MQKDYRKKVLNNRASANSYLLLVLQILLTQKKDLVLLFLYNNKKKYISYPSLSLIFSLLNLKSNSVNAQVTDTTFRDYNKNGIKNLNEIGIGDISITTYNACGTAFDAVTTANDGRYTISSVTGQVRIEFRVPETIGCFNEKVFSTARGSASVTSVEFVTASVINVDFGVNNPEDYNFGINNPQLFSPCYVNGYPLTSGSGTTSGSMDRFVVGSGVIYSLAPTEMSFKGSIFLNRDNNPFNSAATPITRTRAIGSAPAYGNGFSYQISGNNDRIVYLGGRQRPLR